MASYIDDPRLQPLSSEIRRSELAKAQARIAELERLVGRQQADIDFFRKALRSWDEKRRVSDAPICSPSSRK
jgi:hypothetical protein